MLKLLLLTVLFVYHMTGRSSLHVLAQVQSDNRIDPPEQPVKPSAIANPELEGILHDMANIQKQLKTQNALSGPSFKSMTRRLDEIDARLRQLQEKVREEQQKQQKETRKQTESALPRGEDQPEGERTEWTLQRSTRGVLSGGFPLFPQPIQPPPQQPPPPPQQPPPPPQQPPQPPQEQPQQPFPSFLAQMPFLSTLWSKKQMLLSKFGLFGGGFQGTPSAPFPGYPGPSFPGIILFPSPPGSVEPPFPGYPEQPGEPSPISTTEEPTAEEPPPRPTAGTGRPRRTTTSTVTTKTTEAPPETTTPSEIPRAPVLSIDIVRE